MKRFEGDGPGPKALPLPPSWNDGRAFKWRDEQQRECGSITLRLDENGLPVLLLETEDPESTGVLQHKDLFQLVTALALLVTRGEPR